MFAGRVIDFNSDFKRLYSLLPLPGQYQPDYTGAWGKPRIPAFEELDQSIAHTDGCINARSATSFSSTYEIPLSNLYGVQSPPRHDFTIWSTYLHFDCPSIEVTTVEHIQSVGILLAQSPGQTMLMAVNPQNDSSSGVLTFASSIISSSNSYAVAKFAYAVCNFNQAFVDSQIHCDGPDYQVTNMRLSTIYPSLTAMKNDTLIADFVDASLDNAYVPTDHRALCLESRHRRGQLRLGSRHLSAIATNLYHASSILR